MRNFNLKRIKLFILLIITFGIFLHIIKGSLHVTDMDKPNPIAENGILDLRGWDFSKDGIIKLNGDWEFYKDELLTPKDFINSTSKKAFSSIPGTLGGFGYGTYRLKILVDSDDIVYSVKIDYVQNAYKLWANNREIQHVGKVGKSKNEISPQNLPRTASFYTENGEVFLTLQVSNFYSKYGFVDSILMGEASKIENFKEKKLAFDLFLFGSSVIAAIYNFAIFSKRKKDYAPLYFAIVCIIVALRTLFLGERFLISLFPEFNYILSGKIMIWTFYLYIPFIVLFIHKTYGNILNKTLVKISNFSGVLYFFLVIISPPAFFLQLILPFEIFALIILHYLMVKISKVYIKTETNDYVAIVGLFALFITRINDILYEFSIIITSSFAPLGVFIFIIANYYVLAERQAKAFSKSEAMGEKLKSLNSLKDDFLAITSHELQTPLNGIIGLAEDLGSSNKMDRDDKNSLFLIKSSAERLSSLVNDIVVFSKLKNNEVKLTRRSIKINKLVEMVLKLSEPSTRNKDIEIVNLIDSKVPFIYVDENRIQQILYNLLGNAIKFTHEGKIILSYEVNEKYLGISIEDSGIGIPEEKLNTIFELYEQVEEVSEKYGGTGLGLYITKNLVELHGGRIQVNSIIQKGTKFTFTLPLCSPSEDYIQECAVTLDMTVNNITNELDEEPAKTSEDYENRDGKKNYRILIVDDEYLNQKVLQNHLSRLSEDIIMASTGKEALEIVRNESLDLIILDMMIPDMMGYEIATEIRKDYSLFQLPILMMTANNRQENLVTSFECGANDYLKKPFNKFELLSRVSTLLTLKTSVEEALLLVHQVTLANEKIDVLNLKNIESTKKVAELLEFDKLKTEFFTNISHELKTPLNVISSTIQLLKSLDESRVLGDDKIKYYFNIINQNSLRLLKLINNLIDSTKIDGNYLNLNSINGDIVYAIEELVQSVAAFIQSKGINIVFDTEVEEKFISFDEEKIERIILNLLSNAVKFTGENGNIFVNIYDRTNFIEISVKDTGIGIPEDKLELIFERFGQVDRSTTRKKEGSGIGLSLVKSLVEMHGGNIYVKSEINKGSEFVIKLPTLTIDSSKLEHSLTFKNLSNENHDEKLQLEFSDIYFIE